MTLALALVVALFSAPTAPAQDAQDAQDPTYTSDYGDRAECEDAQADADAGEDFGCAALAP